MITSSTDGDPGDRAAFVDWDNTLNPEGVRYDTVVTSSQGLPARSSTAPDGTEGAAKNKLFAGSFTLKIAGQKLGHRLRFRSPETDRFTVALSTKMMAVATQGRHHHKRRMVGSLLISTTQTHAKARLTRGTLTIRV